MEVEKPPRPRTFTKSTLSLSEIKEQLKGTVTRSGELLGSSSLLSAGLGGIPKGILCEITGSARTEWVLSFLAENDGLKIFWCEERLSILPTAIHQRGVNLKNILIAEAGTKLFQTTRKALRSKLFDCLVLPGAIHEVKMLKALQLFARESNACVLFLSNAPQAAWAIPLQLRINWSVDSKKYAVEILKSKVSCG
jgi:hypothetical protein